MSESDITDPTKKVFDLIESGICPPWWVPSKSVLGRCLPTLIATENGDPIKNETVIVTQEQTNAHDDQDVTGFVMEQSLETVADILNYRYSTKSRNCYGKN